MNTNEVNQIETKFKIVKPKPTFYKSEVIDLLQKNGRENVRKVIIEFIKEHNKLNPNKKINLRSHQIPYIIYEKVVEHFNYD